MAASAPDGSTTTHDAFISYSRKDRAFAQRLEKALKAWRPPRELGLPQRELGVFRDESDFTGTDYYAAIERHLQGSRKLIVICSPAARASSYVDDEIRRFVRLHEAADVVPLLLHGVPNNEAGPDRAQEMAFPAALCEALQMPLAVSYLGFDTSRDRPDKAGFEGAWYQLLANLLDRSRAEVEQRDKRRQARRRRIGGAVVASVVLLLSVALVLTLLARDEAVQQRDIAEQRRVEAEEQRRIADERRRAALARQLNVEADAALAQPRAADLQRSLLLRLESLAAGWTAEGHAALLRSIDRLAQPPQMLQARTGPPALSLAYSRDGRWFASLTDTTRVRDTTSAEGARILDAPRATVPLVFSPDGRWLLGSCPDAVACLWSTEDWQPARQLPGREELQSAAFSPDGSLLVSAQRIGGGFRLLDVERWDAPTWIGRHEAALREVARVAFSPDGRWLATQGNDALRLWDVTGRRLALEAEVGRGDALAFSPDGKLLLHGGESDRPGVAAVAVDAAGRPQLTPDSRFQLHRSFFRTPAAFSPDGAWLAYGVGDDRSVAFVSTRTGQEVSRIAPRSLGIAFDPHGAGLAVGHDDGSITLWAPHRPEARRIEQAGTTALALDRDGRHLVLLDDKGSVRVFAAADARPLARIETAPGAGALDFSPDGRWLLVRGKGHLHVIAAADWRVVLRLDGDPAHGDPSWTPDGRWLLLMGSGQVWRHDTNAWSADAAPIDVYVDRLAVSPDGRWLATHTPWSFSRGVGLTHPSMTRVWDLASGVAQAWVSHEDEDLKNSMFGTLGRAKNATGEWTQARSGGDAALAQAAPRWPALRGVDERVPEQPWITTADAHGRRLADAHLDRAATAHGGPVTAWAYSADGHWFGSAGADATVRLWPVQTQALVADACRRIGRNLSDDEWRRHFGDEPLRATCPPAPPTR